MKIHKGRPDYTVSTVPYGCFFASTQQLVHLHMFHETNRRTADTVSSFSDHKVACTGNRFLYPILLNLFGCLALVCFGETGNT